jgi:signal transduction histidine kinase
LSVPAGDAAAIAAQATELTQVRAELVQFRTTEAQQARELEAARYISGELLGHLSNDFFVSLAAIVGFSELLASGHHGDLNARQQEDIHAIRDAAHSIRRVNDDLVDLARIMGGYLMVRPSRVSLADVLNAGVREQQAALERRKVNVQVDVPADLGDIEVDHRQICKVISRLLAAMVEFTSLGGDITLVARRREEMVEIAVQGMDTDLPDADHAWMLAALRPSEAAAGVSVPSGRDVGLIVVQRFVEHHGGRGIWVACGPGEDTTFTFQVPRQQEVESLPG